MLTYGIILLGLGIAFAILEALLPSGGILALLSAGSFVGALIFAFQTSTNTGMVFVAIIVVAVPVVFAVGLKVLPHTPIGRRIILGRGQEAKPAPVETGPDTNRYSQLMGKTGKAVTPLRPSGIVEIGPERYSAVAGGEFIDNNVEIVVVRVDGNSIVVDQAQEARRGV